MMEFVFIAMLAVMAWVHARLTVVSVINRTQSPEQMLQRMQKDTWWSVVWVLMAYFMLGALSTWITMYALARSLFLLLTNWNAVCDNYAEIKRLLAGS